MRKLLVLFFFIFMIIQCWATISDSLIWIKSIDNPIMTCSGGWEEYVIGTYCLKDNNDYKLYYTAMQPNVMEVGLMTSADFINWTRSTPNPVIPRGQQAWSSFRTKIYSVIKRDTTYYAFYYGDNQNLYAIGSMGVATSTDGVNWTQHVNNPVINSNTQFQSGGISYLSVIYKDSLFYSYYTNEGTRYIEASSDGEIWNIINTRTDSISIKMGSIRYSNGLYYGLISHALNSFTLYTSYDGLNWTENKMYSLQPFQQWQYSSFEDRQVGFSLLIDDENDEISVFFNSCPGRWGQYRVGVATAENLLNDGSCADYVSPYDMEEDIAIDAPLTWNAMAGVTSYKLYLGTTPENYDLLNGQIVTSTSFNYNFNYSTAYFWKVTADNGLDNYLGCPEWSFTTVENPVRNLNYEEDFESGTMPLYMAITEQNNGIVEIVPDEQDASNYCLKSSNLNASQTQNTVEIDFAPYTGSGQVDLDFRYRVVNNVPALIDLSAYILVGQTQSRIFNIGSSMDWTDVSRQLDQYDLTNGFKLKFEMITFMPRPLQKIFLDDISVTVIPQINPDFSNLEHSFDNTMINTSSTAMQFSVTGADLTDNLVITMPDGFESAIAGGDFQTQPLSIAPNPDGTITASIAIRFSPVNEGNHQGDMLITTANASPESYSLTGLALGTPTLNFSSNFDGDFGRQIIGTSSVARTYNISGSNFTGFLMINAPSGYDLQLVSATSDRSMLNRHSVEKSNVSTSNGTNTESVLSRSENTLLSSRNNYSVNMSLTDIGEQSAINAVNDRSTSLALVPDAQGNIALTGISVTFTPSDTTSYDGFITHYSDNYPTETVQLSGTGVPVPMLEVPYCVKPFTSELSNEKIISVDISGSKLLSDITISSTSNDFSLSGQYDGTYSQSLTVSPSNEMLDETFYLKYNALTQGIIEESITFTGLGVNESLNLLGHAHVSGAPVFRYVSISEESVINGDPIFVWEVEDEQSVIEYEWQISASPIFDQYVLSNVTTDTFYNLAFNLTGTYYARIKAVNTAGESWSETVQCNFSRDADNSAGAVDVVFNSITGEPAFSVEVLSWSANPGEITSVISESAVHPEIPSGYENYVVERVVSCYPHNNNGSIYTNIELHYTDAEVFGLEEEMLHLYRYQDGTWTRLDSTFFYIDTQNNVATAQYVTTHSDWILYDESNGQLPQDSKIYTNLKLILQGPYDNSSGMMRTDLNSYLPLASPYGDLTAESIPAEAVDWIYVELRTSDAGATITGKSILLHNDGYAYSIDGSIPSFDIPLSSYYIVIRHRNHLDIMSEGSHFFSENAFTGIEYDFTQSGNTFTTGLNDAGVIAVDTGLYAMAAGDIVEDGTIVSSDNTQWETAFSAGVSDGYHLEDIDMDGAVLSSDNTLWAANFQNGQADSQVPGNTETSTVIRIHSRDMQPHVRDLRVQKMKSVLKGK